MLIFVGQIYLEDLENLTRHERLQKHWTSIIQAFMTTWREYWCCSICWSHHTV